MDSDSTSEARHSSLSPVDIDIYERDDGWRIPMSNRPMSNRPLHEKKIPRAVIKDGVEVRHQVTRNFRDRHGKLSTNTWDDDPSKDVQPVEHDINTPTITFLREVNERGELYRRAIQVDWFPFGGFLETIEKFPIFLNLGQSSISFVEPFVDLFLRHDALRGLVDNTGHGEEALNQSPEREPNLAIARQVLQYIDREAHGTLSRLEELKTADPQTKVRYDDLWMLYRPGTLVFHMSPEADPLCYMVDAPIFEKPSFASLSELPQYNTLSPRLQLKCWTVGLGEGSFGRRNHDIDIVDFSGSIEISQLPFVPELFLKDKEKVKAYLKSRGQEFWNMQIRCSFREVVSTSHSQPMHEERTRVIVDRVNHQRQMFPDIGKHASIPLDRASNFAVADWREERENSQVVWDKSSSSTWFSDYDVIEASKQPDELVLLLCPRTVFAFRLRDKTWVKYDVMDLHPVQFRENAWSRLVLNNEYKDILRAMVKSYLSGRTKFQDLVVGKGVGLVVLLHGPPGVGKTLTAECVAESFKKPLYMVTAGDLGTNPEHLEQKLSMIFNYAVSWNAVLLLDEADIFLQDRDYDNLQRNALVSIFLRTLEYFNGIMFLTSNRVGAFDQAFQSRIHITIGMPEFDGDLRKDVWKIFIQDLGRKRSDGSPALLTHDECRELGRQVIDSWASQPLNGRQIRNCVRSALALAEDKEVKPNASHFNTVIRLGNTFTKYMHKLQKAESDQVAQIKGDRLAAMRDIMMDGDQKRKDQDEIFEG